VDDHVPEGHLAREGAGHHRHPGHPEKDDVEARHQHAGGIPALQIGGALLGPAQGGEGPEAAGEPGVEGVGVLLEHHRMGVHTPSKLPLRLGAGFRLIAGHHVGGAVGDLSSGFAHHKPGGDAVAPPQLAGDAPVADVGEPVAIHLAPALRHEAGIGSLQGLAAASRQGLRFHEPLGGEQGLHRHLAAVGERHAVAVGLHLCQKAALLHRRHHRLARLEAIQASEAPGRCVHGAVLGHHRDQRQVVALANGEVVGVVGGGHLDATRAEVGVHVVVGHDRNLAPHQRQGEALAHQRRVARILGIHRHGRVTQQGFGAGGGHFEMGAAIGRRATRERIAEVPEVAVHLLHLHLQIAHRRAGGGAPVHQVFAPVDQPLLVQAVEGLNHRGAAAGIKGEALPLPVHRIAQAAQLAHDRAAAACLPGPGLLQEGLAAQVFLALALRLELLLEDRLHGDRGVVGAGQAEHVFAPQALEAHDCVDQGRVEGVAHVQAAGDVRRRDDDGKGLTLRRRVWMEGAAGFPGLLPTRFGTGRVVGLGQGRFRGREGGGGLGHGGGAGDGPMLSNGNQRTRAGLHQQR
jgi:hypothetical protein